MQNLKNINPELSTTDIAKKLGEKWQKMSAEEKQPYVEQSQVDKKRYAEESAAYRGAGAAPVDVDSADGSSD
uniref:HMG box domain-containing protein n=1 Tax=Aegilops tauschii subsp. strangulata TaxID=200361 RepID=A0A452Y5B4_AEGTS